MSYALGSRSLGRLEGVHPDLVRVVKRAIEITTQDFMVTEGLRTLARQKDLYAQGRTKPGPVVTWTLKSKHIDGLAVDLVPFNDGKPDWTAGKNFDEIAKAMRDAAEELGVQITWGKDWNRNGHPGEKGESDSPHFQLA
jgi:peptidoglycan L-alanyl-D-glutamate endopeptidase CwlK